MQKSGDKAKLIVLMYHEIVGEGKGEIAFDRMARSYFIPTEMFEKHLDILSENAFESVQLEDMSKLAVMNKYVALTFDDGWIGNYKYAWPILKKYRFNGTVFVATELIGTAGFMNWSQLKELSRHGISVQSHGVTHRPLNPMTEEEIYKELYDSKQIIESKMGMGVTAISFPHGSFDRRVVRIADEVGYKIMCTSEIKVNHIRSVGGQARRLGRITMTNKITCHKFSKVVQYDGKELWKRRLIKGSKNALKGIIGIQNYQRLYKRYFGIGQER